MYKLVAHRGYPARYPENTLIGIEAALLAGARAVEFDVQCSADGTPYVFHDESLLRLTGHNGHIFHHSDDFIENLYAHYPERFGQTYHGNRVTRLRDLVNLLVQHPEVEVFVEPKAHSLEHFGTTAVMDRILLETAALGTRRRMISFHHEALAYARDRGCPEIAWVLENFSPASAARARELMPDILCADVKILPPALPEWIEASWMIYPMDDASQLEHYAAMGIDYIETDNIGEMLNTLATLQPSHL